MLIQPQILTDILFIDIETVSEVAHYAQLSDERKQLWNKKAEKFLKLTDSSEDHFKNTYEGKAGIFAEFAKVICITVGYLKHKEDNYTLRVKTFHGHDESEVLLSFCKLMDKYYDNPSNAYICGHNIREFDIPFLCRRLVINGLPFPKMLRISGKKPWEVEYLKDTMVLWKFGDYKSYTSLTLLASSLGIPSPKDDIDGSQVSQVYWNDEDLERIVHYCEKDVVTVVQVMMRFASLPLLEPSQIEYIRK